MSVLLSTHQLCVELAGARVVSDVMLAVAPGEIVALLGPNGAGKTTLMRAALGLLTPSAGAVSLGGADPLTLSVRARALRAAYLPQRPQAIWPVPVEHLVALGRYAYGAAPTRLGAKDQAAVDAALEACALVPLRARPMNAISGGEKARAHLARALAQQAPLLVLDEPTAGLDPGQTLAAADVLAAHARGGGGVLFSSHDVTLAARLAHRVLLLREGRVLAQGAPMAALTPEALAAAYGRSGRLERVGDVYAVVFS